ncbi:GUAD deaminase, partial [Nyctiprogne leucopyga]|nr:GUAD deaminase [Nyctiprogne leucopyga]
MGSPQRPPLAHVFRGTFVHSSPPAPMEILHGHLLGVDESGTIVFLERTDQQEQLAKKWKFKTCDIRELSNHEFFMPGMVDTHIHAPQYSFTGTRVDLPLLQWLTTYTFPTEAKYKDNDFAEEVYTRVVVSTANVIYGLDDICILILDFIFLRISTDKFGQRAFVGKVCMDMNDSVPQYKESTADSVQETERFVKELLEKKYPRVQPVITPRFGPSCTEDLLCALGEVAQARDLHVQSHISENEEELNLVENMFPAYQNYTELYDKNKLLTSKPCSSEFSLYVSHRTHFFFQSRLRSGVLNVQKVLKHKVKLGLGTDVAGGYSASMLDAIRKTMMASNSLQIYKVNETGLTLEEAFQLATLGGSQALGLDDVIGNFEVGKEFDALLINTKASDSPFDLFSADNFEVIRTGLMIQKITGNDMGKVRDDRNISEVYVAGKQVVPFSSSV